MSKALSLMQKDSFFDDAFFKDDWCDFDQAMQQVLDKFHSEKVQISTTNRSNCTDVYRKIRSSNIEKDLYQSQALQVTEKDGKFQCVMDVKDFNPNDLKVKVVDDRVVVEGKFEHKSEDGTSMTSKSFYKEFTLPNAANIEQIATALSKDGVLSIKAPKKEGAVVAAPAGGVQQSSTSSSTVEESSSSTVSSVPNGSSSTTTQESKESSFSSTSTSSFSSTKKVSVTSSSTVSSTNVSSNLESSLVTETDDMAKDLQDRLLFTHDSVNVKLPENK